jgi:demethylmenaquinone methyltransferase/2-methoxy-6-polyprenyl-1,4-benzoquinol methylase
VTPTPGRPTAERVAAMFGRIADRYDLMNSLMTGSQDEEWRAATVQAVNPPLDGLALDVGTGTGRLAATLAQAMPGGRVIALDLTLPMLRAGRAWLRGRDEAERIRLLAGDALALPFADARFDCVTSAFTVRNLSDLERGFREQVRVVKPGGTVACLELTWPRSLPMKLLFPLFFGGVVPLVGRVVTGDGAAYAYLPASVRAFPTPNSLATIMRQAGLIDVRWRRLGLGAVALHVGRRP